MPRGKTAVWRKAFESKVRAVSSGKGSQNLFIFENLRTHQVLYALRPELQGEPHEEARLLKQITFVGKKSVPSTLRPDLWRPLATLSFSSEQQCMVVYRKLREYRMMREYCWRQNAERSKKKNEELILQGEEALEVASLLPPAKKGRAPLAKWLMNQTSNSIADLAAVMEQQSQVARGLHESLHTKWLKEQEAWLRTPQEEFESLKKIAENEDQVNRIRMEGDAMAAQVEAQKNSITPGNAAFRKKAIAQSAQYERLAKLQAAADARKQGDIDNATKIEAQVLHDLQGRIRSVQRVEERKFGILKEVALDAIENLTKRDRFVISGKESGKATIKWKAEEVVTKAQLREDFKTKFPEASEEKIEEHIAESLEHEKQKAITKEENDAAYHATLIRTKRPQMLAAERIRQWIAKQRPDPPLSPNLPELGPARRLVAAHLRRQEAETDEDNPNEHENPVYIHWADLEHTRLADWPENVYNLKWTGQVRNAVGMPPPPRVRPQEEEPQLAIEDDTLPPPQPSTMGRASGFFSGTLGKVKGLLRMA